MENVSGKKILVTGGAGFIGSHIVDKLVSLGAKVTVLDNLSSGKMSNLDHHGKNITFIKGDICDAAILEKVLPGIDAISHQAALRSVPKSVERPLDYNEVNVTGTLNLFLKARDHKIKRIVCASSSSVYGDRTDFPEIETDMPKPISPYAATKLIVENYSYVCSQMYGLDIVNLRYFNVFGPRQSLDDQYAVVVPKFIHCLLNNQQPPIFGDGEQERDFTYVENVADVNVKCLTACNISGEVFNVAAGKPNSVNELYKTLALIIKSQVRPDYLPVRKGDVRKTHADISKLQTMLGWKPLVNFEDGLRKTVEYFKKTND